MAKAQVAEAPPVASTKTTQTQRHDLRAELVGLVLLFAGLAFGAALVQVCERMATGLPTPTVHHTTPTYPRSSPPPCCRPPGLSPQCRRAALA